MIYRPESEPAYHYILSSIVFREAYGAPRHDRLRSPPGDRDHRERPMTGPAAEVHEAPRSLAASYAAGVRETIDGSAS
jgi:hypothetical protein